MKLGYRTRGQDVSPQGKPRVYFCCHPEDFEKHFYSISDEILRIENCTVFYDDTTGEDTETDREEVLSGMQLFVMPVTSRLLKGENRGLSDYRIAVKHHVPVLPLMQESGLDSLFNEVCGTLQFLDKYAKDDTAISYEDKLKRFINDLLVDTESAEIIRQSFRAYIFLSYRKKDRAHAQRLMKLIHKNKNCRDVAIWYDEFLVPGEDFNSSINDALCKSQLFLLAVTPNLVNEPNYVERVEYPNAVKSGKEILPVEMYETDRSLLNEKYINIPCVIREDDEKGLARQLSKIFPEKKRPEKDFDRDFCIARAYLDGIDLEVDHTIALEMLTMTASKLHMDSMRMLVRMYRDGKGVARDINVALSWQLKLVGLLEKDFKSNKSVVGTLIQEINTLIGFYGMLRDYKAALEYALRAVKYIGGCTEADIEDRDVYEYTALNSVGNTYKCLYNIEKAREYFSLAFEVASKIADIDNSSWAKTLVCNCASRIAQTYQDEGDFVPALEYFSTVTQIIEECFENDTESRELLGELFDAYEDMYGIAMAIDDYSIAGEYADKLLPIAERFSQEFGGLEADEMLCSAYRALGSVAEAEGDFELCDKYYKILLEIRLKACEDGDPVSAKQDLATAYALLSTSAQNLQSMHNCERYMLECVKLREELASDYPIPEMLSALCRAYDLVGSVYNMLDRPEAALEYHEREFEIAQGLAKENPNAEFLTALAECHMSLGCDYALYFGDDDREHFEAGLAIMESLHKRLNNDQSLNNLALYYQRLAEVYSYDQPRRARAYIDKALRIRENYLKTHDNLDTWLGYIDCLLSYAYSLYEDELEDEAEEQYKKAYAAVKKLLTRSDNLKILRAYANCCAKIADFHANSNKPEAAVEYYAERLAVLMQMVEGTESVSARNQALSAAILLGMEYNGLEEYERAKEAFLLAQSIFDSFEDNEYIDGDEADEKNLCKYLGYACKSLGELDEAIEYFEKYIEVCQRESSNHADGYRFIAEVYADKGEYDRAAELFLQCANVEREFIEAEESDYLEDLCNALISAGDCCRFDKNYKAAIEVYLSALEAVEQMEGIRFQKAQENEKYYGEQKAYREEHPEEYEDEEDDEYKEYAMDDDDFEPEEEEDFYDDYYEACRTRSLTLIKLAVCYGALGDMENAELYYRASAEISIQLMDSCDSTSDMDRFAFALTGLGKCGHGDAYEEAYKIYCSLAEDDPETYEPLADEIRKILEK